MRAILPLNLSCINQAQVALVDQARCLQRMVAALTSHVATRQLAQFGVYERRQCGECRFIALAPCPKQLRDPMRR